MNPETRPNIIPVGAAAGGLSGVAIAPIIVWAWNGWAAPKGLPVMDAVVGTALGGVVAVAIGSLAQLWDRSSKRAARHVLNKHGARDVHELFGENEAGVR